MIRPTESDHRIALQVMNIRYAEEAAQIVAEYRAKIQKELVEGVLLLMQDKGKAHAASK